MIQFSGKEFIDALPRDIEFIELFEDTQDNKSNNHKLMHISDMVQWLFEIGTNDAKAYFYYRVVQINPNAIVKIYNDRIACNSVTYRSDFESVKDYIMYRLDDLDMVEQQKLCIKYPYLVLYIPRNYIRPVAKSIIKRQKIWRYVVEYIYNNKD